MTQAYTLSVTKFNNIIRDIFNNEELLHNIQIVGEVFGVSISKNSTYFTLRDENSALPCVCFYGDLMSNIKEGDMVVATGSPNFYAKSGKFNFVVNRVEPFGLGLLYQKFVELKEKLEKEGLFAQEHKKTIPENIKRIGVVTSKDGAVIQDIKNVCWRRNKAVDIVLYNTKVQGNGAEKEIVDGINFFSEYENIDVVIVARGGGSLEDLSAYNTEEVARATYACKKPIVSAVGHETDFTIIDFVSDLRAPTPSAGAELLTKDVSQLKITFKKDISKLSRMLDIFVANKTTQLNSAKNNIFDICEDLMIDKQSKLHKLTAKLSNKIESIMTKWDYDLKLKISHVNKLNPLDIMALGYAKIEQNGKNVRKLSQLDTKNQFEINFIDGILIAKGEEK